MKLCQYRFTSGPMRGLKCEASLIATCDRSKPSQPVECMEETKNYDRTWIMNMYSEAEEQNNLCFYHQQKEKKAQAGGES